MSDTLKIEDYLHLYLGCDFMMPNGIINSVFGIEPDLVFGTKITVGFKKFKPNEIKPILRPLSDLSNKEQSELQLLKEQMEDDVHNSDLEIFAALGNKCRSWGIDIDGLIEAGIAIDKTTLK